MSHAEEVFYSHLTDVESLDFIVKEGFSLEVVQNVLPTEVGRKLTAWAIEYYFQNDRKVAPSKQAILDTWGEHLQAVEIEIDDENELDGIQWAIEQLRSEYADYLSGEFVKSMATEVRNADVPDRVEVIVEYSNVLYGMTQTLISRKNEMAGGEGLADAIHRYEQRAAEDHVYDGLRFGFDELDDHILGLHNGELAVVAGTAGGGKSWFTLKTVLTEYLRGRKPILYTIENDLEMTYDRLACMHTRVPYEKWQRATCDKSEVDRVREFLDQMKNSDAQPLIIHPPRSEATGAYMIRRALVEGADSVIIDQLSHIQPVAQTRARQRNEIVAEIVQDLNYLISEGGKKIPLVLMHQINRKGREDARKIGRFLMDHLGEATQVENEADFVYAIYQSPDHVVLEQAELQCLKSRRVKSKSWEIEWRPAVGDIRIRKELDD